MTDNDRKLLEEMDSLIDQVAENECNEAATKLRHAVWFIQDHMDWDKVRHKLDGLEYADVIDEIVKSWEWRKQ